MFRSFLPRFATGLAIALLLAGALGTHPQDSQKRGRKYKTAPPTARIDVTILRDVDGKPIENAAVIFHPKEGERDKGNMELKSNEDGKAVIDVLPIGDTVRLQIIAKGFQTYGQDYKLDKPQLAIEVRMKRPGEQYSIYKEHPDDAQNQEKDKPKDESKPSDKPAPPPSN
jgi:hypothetical protein